MENNLNELWERRLFLQKFPLIGDSTPGQGNGFHDRVSFDVPYHLKYRKKHYDPQNELYSIYFRDLANFLNPQYRKDRGKSYNDALKLLNCSENYKNTLMKYLGSSNRWRDEGFLDVLGKWGDSLLYHGKVIIEFVSWYDNQSKDFYAFELENVDVDHTQSRSQYIRFIAPYQDEHGQTAEKKVDIPLSKCVIIQWPQALGGYSNYLKKVESVLSIGSKLSPLNTLENYDPAKSLARMKEWDIKFNKYIYEWGATNPLKETTEFFKEDNFFTLKETLIHCNTALIDGLSQIVSILNKKLNENARLEFSHPEYDLKKCIENRDKWNKGEMSFKEANEFLRFY